MCVEKYELIQRSPVLTGISLSYFKMIIFVETDEKILVSRELKLVLHKEEFIVFGVHTIYIN